MTSPFSKIAALFPGQGSHALGMGLDIAAQYGAAAEVFAQGQQVLPALGEVIEHGPLQELTLTANQQPALVLASVAAYRAWYARTGLIPFAAAGHSLGEYSALVASGALSLADALRLTHKRGKLMQQAVAVGEGAMVAIMGDAGAVQEVCSGIEGVQPANYNTPSQTVISGQKAAVEQAVTELKARGLKAVPLKVSAPFHCPLMQPAAEGLAPDLQAVPLEPMQFPVIANVTAQPVSDSAQVPDLLTQQITASVQWVKSVEHLREMGTELFVEFGPGTVLAGLVKKIAPEVRVVNVGTAQQVAEFGNWEV